MCLFCSKIALLAEQYTSYFIKHLEVFHPILTGCIIASLPGDHKFHSTCWSSKKSTSIYWLGQLPELTILKNIFKCDKNFVFVAASFKNICWLSWYTSSFIKHLAVLRCIANFFSSPPYLFQNYASIYWPCHLPKLIIL